MSDPPRHRGSSTRRPGRLGVRGLRVHVCDGVGRSVDAPGLAAWLIRTVPARYQGVITIAIVSDTTSRRLNRVFRGVDRPTDVLSFPASDGWWEGRPCGDFGPTAQAEDQGPQGTHLGDIVIAKGVATRQARRLGHALGTELRVLALHGVLHLIGYDHERPDSAMPVVEARWRRRGGLSASLTERSRTA